MRVVKPVEYTCDECGLIVDVLYECSCTKCERARLPTDICFDCLQTYGLCKGLPEPPDILCSQCGEVLLWYLDHYGCQPCGRTVKA